MADIEKLLVVGGGGREFALLEEALRSGVSRVYSTRDKDAVNLGIEGVINTGLGDSRVQDIGSFASQEEIDLVIVGPEAPLVAGLGDVLRSKGVPTYGPGADGAMFESDKCVTHRFVEKYGLPNPDNSETFTPDEREAAKDLIRRLGPENIFTKRVGLESGKGAIGYAEDELEAALSEVDAVADKGEQLLIQGRLLGSEYSAMFILDGQGNAVATALSRDHKALFDGGLGPNTGGMGAYAPLSLEHASVRRRSQIGGIGLQIADGLVREGIDYRGTLYVGLMAETPEADSRLRVLEFNVRLGDPEAQVSIPSLDRQAINYMYAAARGSGELDMSRLYLEAGKAMVSLTICLASPGYAQQDASLITGLPIRIPNELPEGISIQFAAAKMIEGVPVSGGGRALYVTKTAPNLAAARKVYDFIGRVNNGIYIGDDQQVIRTDIGLV